MKKICYYKKNYGTYTVPKTIELWLSKVLYQNNQSFKTAMIIQKNTQNNYGKNYGTLRKNYGTIVNYS